MFDEANTVEALVVDILTPAQAQQPSGIAEEPGVYGEAGWRYVPPQDLPRAETDVLVEAGIREALIRLKPSIAEQPDHADEVIYRLRAIIQSVGSDGLVRANEEFAAWLNGERSMPFGPNNQHVTVHLIDFAHLSNNRYVVTNQYTYIAGQERRPDIALLVNGIPLVIGEAKTPVRPAVSWVDGASQVHDDYEENIPGRVTTAQAHCCRRAEHAPRAASSNGAHATRLHADRTRRRSSTLGHPCWASPH